MMQQIGIDTLQVAFVLVSTWLGSKTKSSQFYRLAFLALLCLGSLYVGWFGLNMISPEMAKVSPISASGRRMLMVAFSGTAVISGLLLMPSTQRILARTTGWSLQTPQRVLGSWLFVIMFLINVAFLLVASSYAITLITVGTGQSNKLLNEFAHELSYTAIAVVGTGLYIRRRPSEMFQRLGLASFPESLQAVLVAILVAGGLIIAGMLGGIWLQQNNHSAFLYLQFTMNSTVPGVNGSILQRLSVALFIGLVAGIGEEVLFRGLLQPTFGLVPTALLFTAVHSQFGLSPVLVLIFALGIGCGWLRQRYSTWAAMLAHSICTTILIFGWWFTLLH